jgi:hypothetical protein
MLKVKVVAVLQNHSQLDPIAPQLRRLSEAADGEIAVGWFVGKEYPQLRKALNVGADAADVPALVAVTVPQGDKYVVPFKQVRLRNEMKGSSMSYDAIDR